MSCWAAAWSWGSWSLVFSPLRRINRSGANSASRELAFLACGLLPSGATASENAGMRQLSPSAFPNHPSRTMGPDANLAPLGCGLHHYSLLCLPLPLRSSESIGRLHRGQEPGDLRLRFQRGNRRAFAAAVGCRDQKPLFFSDSSRQQASLRCGGSRRVSGQSGAMSTLPSTPIQAPSPCSTSSRPAEPALATSQ